MDNLFEKNTLLDELEKIDKGYEKPMTNQEYINNYLAKCLYMLLDEEEKLKGASTNSIGGFFTETWGEKRKNDIAAIKYYLSKKSYSAEPVPVDLSRAASVKNSMGLELNERYKEKHDAKFVDAILDRIGFEDVIFEVDSEFHYGHEFIKALADIGSTEEGVKKIMDALKVMFRKSENIMPYDAPETYARGVKKLESLLDDIVKYGINHRIINAKGGER